MEKRSIALNELISEYPQKKEMLLSGSCGAIFGMSVISNGSVTRAVYDTRGYRKLGDMRNLSASRVLYLAEKVLLMAAECEDYLFFADEYVLSVDTVYFSEENDRARLLYIPCEKRKGSEREKTIHTECVNDELSIGMANFVNQMKPLTTDNGRLYLETLIQLFLCENLRTERIIGFIERLRHEIYSCAIS